MKTKIIFFVALVLLPLHSHAWNWHRWVSGYIASWNLNMSEGAANYGNQPYTEIDLDAMTHLIMFNASLDSTGNMNTRKEWDGSLTWGSTLLEKRRKPFNEYVHSRGKCILLTIFGIGKGGDWTKMVANPEYRVKAIKTIVDSVILGAKYDGVDLDIEPFCDVDTLNTRLFIEQLYDTLQNYNAWYDRSKKPLLVAAVYRLPQFWASVAHKLDQINIMTYDMFAGLWTTKTWHNCPVFSGGATDTNGYELTSIQNKTRRWISYYGVPKEKVGCGISAYGYIWKGGRLKRDTTNGVTAPLQEWHPKYPPSKVYYWGREYFWLRKNYIDTATTIIHYDELRKCPYIGVDSIGYEGDTYITFSDTSTVKEVVMLADSMDIGGLIFYDVQSQYLNKKDFPESNYPGIERNPLMKSVKNHALNKLIPNTPKGTLTSSKTILPAGGGTITLTWTSENADSALLDFVDSVKVVPLNGSVSVSVTTTKTFTLRLSNSTSNIYCFVDIIVQQPVSVQQSLSNLGPDNIFQVGQNYPNPFNESTSIPLKIFEKTRLKLVVYDIYGREIAVLMDEKKDSGDYKIRFAPADLDRNLNLASGIYFYSLRAQGFTTTKTMLYLK